MTAMNVVKSHDRIVIISDAAAYDDDGTLTAIAPKVEMLPHLPGFLMQSGGSAWTPAIVAMAMHLAADTDELFDRIEWILPEVVRKFAGISNVPMGRVLFGGWSTSQNSMRLGCVFSEEAAALDQKNQSSGTVVQPDAFTLQEFNGDQLLMQPPFDDALWLQGWGGKISDLGQIKDMEAFASFALAAQRTIGAPHRGVGGFGQITTVTKTDVNARVFERYEDQIGEVMLPIHADWNTWRAKRGLAKVLVNVPLATGMSRQQRRALEAKNRKLKVV